MHNLHFVALIITGLFITSLLTAIVCRSTGREYTVSAIVAVFSGGYSFIAWAIIFYAKSQPF